MQNINRVMLTGNLTRDPQSRTNANGVSILNFSMAVNDRVKDKDTNEWKDYANYIDCVVFNNSGWLSRNLHKGTHVAVEGRLRWSTWTDKKSGEKKSKLEVVVDDCDLLSSGSQKPAEDDDLGEEIPF